MEKVRLGRTIKNGKNTFTAKDKSSNRVSIDSERCKGCLLCIPACPSECLKISEKINKSGYKPVVFVDNNKCKSCGFCFLVCPDMAIEVYK